LANRASPAATARAGRAILTLPKPAVSQKFFHNAMSIFSRRGGWKEWICGGQSKISQQREDIGATWRVVGVIWGNSDRHTTGLGVRNGYRLY